MGERELVITSSSPCLSYCGVVQSTRWQDDVPEKKKNYLEQNSIRQTTVEGIGLLLRVAVDGNRLSHKYYV